MSSAASGTPSTPSDVEHYLESNIFPVLRVALADLFLLQPASPLAWLGTRLLECAPRESTDADFMDLTKSALPLLKTSASNVHAPPNPPSVSHSESLLKCKTAVSNALKRRDVNFLQRVFDHLKDASGGLSGQNLIQALQEVDAPNIPASDQEVAEIIKQFDANSNKTLEFGEFQQVVNENDNLQAWFIQKNLPIAADALRPLVGRGSDQLKTLSQLSPADIDHAAAATCAIIPSMLKELHQELQAAFAVESQIEADMKADPSKFNDFYKMACGNITDFHKGLTGRVGMPHLNFKNAMRQEHCERAGCDVQFTTGNYKITTTPRQEWQYIVGSVPCPDMEHNRRLVPISELLQLDSSKTANLCEEEVIAIVLYTGPMFQIYNTILRRYPPEKFEMFEKGDNLFSTTIFVLVSAVQKLSRFTRIPLGTLLYRGLGGKVDLPDIFFQVDDKGCSGYAEWGFLSTTSDRNVALGYSDVKERGLKAMVMFIETSSIDRGADISNFSQYPGEKEFLFLPCSFVQRSRQGGGRVEVVMDGLVTVVPVKVNLNLKTETIEELKGKKKRLHMVSARAMVEELRYELGEWAKSAEVAARLLKDTTRNQDGTFTASTFAEAVVKQCEDVVKRHEDATLEEYVDDGTFRALVGEMLDAKAWAKEKKELWIKDASQMICYLQGWSLRECHRLWQSFLRQRVSATAASCDKASASLQLLVSRSLVKQGVVEEVNADGENVMVQAGGDGWSAMDIHAAHAAGANVAAVDPSGYSCVWNAARYGHKESLEALLDVKGDVTICDNDGASPIFVAAENAHAYCLERLLAARGDVNKCNNNGFSPIHVAVHNGHTNCLELLLAARGDINKCDDEGTSALDIARQKQHSECTRLLEAALVES